MTNKVTVEQAKAILHDPRRAIVIAAEYGISHQHVWNIKNGKWKGRGKGENHHGAKLTNVQVLEIFRDPRTHRAIAADYGVTASVVSWIKTGRTWKHVTGDRTDCRKGGRRPKLTSHDARLIRQDKRPTAIIAREYGVNFETITRVIRRQTWKDVD